MFAYGFEEYTLDCSHEAWADLDIILGDLTKFLVKPLSKGHEVVSMSAVDFSSNSWKSHMCLKFKFALAGQLVVFANFHESRNYFRLGDLGESHHRHNERPFPVLLDQIGVSVAHVFAQVADQFGYLNSTHFDWSPRGLFQVRRGCYEYSCACDERKAIGSSCTETSSKNGSLCGSFW